MPKIQLSNSQATQLVSKWAAKMHKTPLSQSARTGLDQLSERAISTFAQGKTLSREDLEGLTVATRMVCNYFWTAFERPEQASEHLANLKPDFQEVLKLESPVDCTLEDFADNLNDFSQWLYDQSVAMSSTHVQRVPDTFRPGITLIDSLSNMTGVDDGIIENAPGLFNSAMSKRDTPDQWTFLETATVIISLLKAQYFFADPIPPKVDSSRVTDHRSRYISGLRRQHQELFDRFDEHSLTPTSELTKIFGNTLLYWKDDPCFRDMSCHRFKPESFLKEYLKDPQQASDSAHLLGDGAWEQRATSGCANDVSHSPTASDLDAPYELDDSPDQEQSRPFTAPMINTDQTGANDVSHSPTASDLDAPYELDEYSSVVPTRVEDGMRFPVAYVSLRDLELPSTSLMDHNWSE